MNRSLLAEITEVNRRSDDIEVQIRSEQRPELMRQLNLEFRLGLAPKNEVPTVPIFENVIQRMVERANRWSFPEQAGREPVTFKVAQH